MAKKIKLPISKLPVDVPQSPCTGNKPSKLQLEQERRWRAEDDLRTLTRANEIQVNKERMSDVKSLAKEQIKTASKFAK